MDTKLEETHPLYQAHKKAEEIKSKNEHIHFTDLIVTDLYQTAQKIARETLDKEPPPPQKWQSRLDDLCTSRLTGYPIMMLLLCGVFWLTIEGANYPSQLLSEFFFDIQDHLTGLFVSAGAPVWLHGLIVLGMYRSLAWVVSVMLPPMAIFFPLFTLLEDLGYLPRVAFNLDHTFKRCAASGKQALTMCVVCRLDFRRAKPLIFKASRGT